jgi:hypothetical protein
LQKHGLLASYDAGRSWQRVNDPLAEGFFPVVQARRNGGLVAVSATEGLLSYNPSAHSADSGVGTSMVVTPSPERKPKH